MFWQISLIFLTSLQLLFPLHLHLPSTSQSNNFLGFFWSNFIDTWSINYNYHGIICCQFSHLGNNFSQFSFFDWVTINNNEVTIVNVLLIWIVRILLKKRYILVVKFHSFEINIDILELQIPFVIQPTRHLEISSCIINSNRFLEIFTQLQRLSLIHIWRCRRSTLCRSRWSPYH